MDSSKPSVTQIAPVKRSGSQIDRQNHRQECTRIICRNKMGLMEVGRRIIYRNKMGLMEVGIGTHYLNV